jgi:actin-like protein 6A
LVHPHLSLQVTPVEFPNTTESYYKYMQRVIAADVKEAVCRVPDSPFDDNSYANIPTTPYELPDGQ